MIHIYPCDDELECELIGAKIEDIALCRKFVVITCIKGYKYKIPIKSLPVNIFMGVGDKIQICKSFKIDSA